MKEKLGQKWADTSMFVRITSNDQIIKTSAS